MEDMHRKIDLSQIESPLTVNKDGVIRWSFDPLPECFPNILGVVLSDKFILDSFQIRSAV